MEINNEIYDKMAEHWWDENDCGSLATIRYFVNTVRFDYFVSILKNIFRSDYQKVELLDIGCGGGFLSEEFAKIGFDVSGIDPSKNSIEVAQKHANEHNLKINYVHGYGEKLPFESNSFSIVTCCDVFEHVADLNEVVKEISRVLKPGGILFFDTINRTLFGKIILKATQEWKSTSFMEPNLHNWDMFIKPQELFHKFNAHHLQNVEIKGVAPSLNIFSCYMNLRKCKQKKISFEELGKKLNMRISNNTLGVYIGYAIKTIGR